MTYNVSSGTLNTTILCTVPAYIDAPDLTQHVRFVKNKIAVLHCPAQGIPLPNITWLRDGVPLELDERMRMLMSGRQLELAMVRESDTASYTCIADNVAGSAKINYNLTVIGTANFVVSLPYKACLKREVFYCLPHSNGRGGGY